MSSLVYWFFRHYGYWTVFLGIFLEDAGIPVPGETVLIIAAILARTQHNLNMIWVAVIAFAAAVTGDNLGFALGFYGGRRLLRRYRHFFHISDDMISRGQRLLTKHGAVAVCFARFITGLRVISGPLAGTLCMRWTVFTVFNALGAVGWVGTIATLAYIFGQALLPFVRNATWVIAGTAGAGVLIWLWKRRQRR